MRSCPLVSVIIPTYNRADIICGAIESVLQQTYTNTEIIVVDDGSTDGTAARLHSFGDRIRVVVQQNTGPCIARNRGIAVARGEIIAFLDSDDQWLPTKLARQIDLLQRAGDTVPCCLCNCTVLHKDGTRTSTFEIADTMPSCSEGVWLNPADVLSTRFVLFNQAVVIRREVLERVGYFDESLRFGEDYDLPLRLSLEGPWAVIGDELVIYHDASDGSWARKALEEKVRLHEDLLLMRKRVSSLIENNPRHVGLRRTAHRELRRARRELVAVRLSKRDLSVAYIAGHMLHFVERLRRYFFRRSFLYPRMIVQPLG